YEDHLLIRAITRYLRRRLRLVPLARDLAIGGVIQACTEGGPIGIIRRDIADFYESIDPASIRDRLLFDPITTPRVRELLTHFFSQHASGPGIPRGVGLSAVLSELYMQQFDRSVAKL